MNEIEGRAQLARYVQSSRNQLSVGGDLPGFPVGGSLSYVGPKTGNDYVFTNRGGGLVTYETFRPPSPLQSFFGELLRGMATSGPGFVLPPIGPRGRPRMN